MAHAKVPSPNKPDSGIYRIEQRWDDYIDYAFSFDPAAGCGHKEIGNRRCRNDSVCQCVLHIPCIVSQQGNEQNHKHDAGQRYGDRSNQFHNIPCIADRFIPHQQKTARRADNRNGNIRLDRKIHKHGAAAHEAASARKIAQNGARDDRKDHCQFQDITDRFSCL